MAAEAVEATTDDGATARRVVTTAKWCALATEVLTLVYVADIVSGGKLSAAVNPYARRARTRGRELVAGFTREHELVLAGRRLVWDACETVMDHDPAWWAQVRQAAA